jgi:hypothetical protein
MSRYSPTGEYLTQPATQLRVGVEPQDGVGLWQAARQFGAVTLGQATHRDDLGARVRGSQQGIDGVLLGGGDETARVDYDHVGAAVGIDQLPTVLGQPARQFLRIDFVAGTAQSD